MGEIRDIVHGDIVLTDVETKILDTSEFQRLRRLYQLPTVHYVFPTATHTRFSQSIGTLEIADRIIKNIAEELPDDEKPTDREMKYTRYAALLSDIQDPPYYPVFYEDTRNKETIETKLENIRKERLEKICDKVKSSGLELDYSFLLDIYSARQSSDLYFIRQIIDSEVGADRLDYLERDSTYCGVPFGHIDTRIYRQFHKEDNELVLKREAIPIVDNILHSLFHMKYSVYDHKISRGVIRMLKESYKNYLKRRGKSTALQELLEKDDSEFLNELEKEDNHEGLDYIKNIKSRNLIRKVFSLEASTVSDLYLDKWYDYQKYDELEKDVSKELKTNFFLDPVPSKPLVHTPIKVRINSHKYTLDKSPLLKEWYYSNLRKQWKLFFFCYTESASHRDSLQSQLEEIFEWFQLGMSHKPSVRLPSLDIMYAYHDMQQKKDERVSIRNKVLYLPEHQKKSLIELVRLGRATADEVKELTLRSRSLESLYLNELTKKGLIEKKRLPTEGTVFYPLPQTIDILKEIGYTIAART